MSKINKEFEIKFLSILSAIIVVAALIGNYINGGFTLSSHRQISGLIWLSITLLILLITFLIQVIPFEKIQRIFSRFIEKLEKIGTLNLIITIVFYGLFPYLLFGPLTKNFEGYFLRAALLWLFAIIQSFFLKAFCPRRKIVEYFFLSLLFTAALVQGVSNLRDISTYPFSLSWSEGSRFYYASLPFSQSLYGQKLPLSFLHPSRYLIMSLPFLIQGLPLWVHRAWQVFLWIATIGFGSFLLVRRLNISDKLKAIVLVSWSFIFLFQGPVYYHLMICVILVLWGFDRNNFAKSLIFVILASIWAGISRINWFPVPGALAALIYVLEQPYDNSKNFWEYFKQPVIFGIIGTIVSFISQAVYIPISGNLDVKNFTSSFTSDLLWYRLLPSATNSIGILPGIIILCAPILIIVTVHFLRKPNPLHVMRRLFIFAILLVFFIGGLVVSVKIGGGSNLHNLDAFSVFLLCIGAYTLFDKIGKEEKISSKTVWLPSLLLVFLLLTPLGWAVKAWSPFPYFDETDARIEIKELDQYVQQAVAQKQEVLFLDERQLLTFGEIKNVPITSDYELLTLMEMAISKNTDYFKNFSNDLKNHRFGVIIAGQQSLGIQDNTYSFPEENNAWVMNVSKTLLMFYEPEKLLDVSNLVVYVPRNSSN